MRWIILLLLSTASADPVLVYSTTKPLIDLLKTVQQSATILETFEIASFKAVLANSESTLFKRDSDIKISTVKPFKATSIQYDAPWHLNRLSLNRSTTLTNDYCYDKPLNPTTVYVLDAGIKTKLAEFENRAVFGASFASGDSSHGTAVASLITGRTFGSSKTALVYSVQVLDDQERTDTATLIKGLEWSFKNMTRPSVINMSVSGALDDALNAAVEELVANGVYVVVGAGNDPIDACMSSPASAKGVIAVGATDKSDQIAEFSAFGPCVTLYAPGVDMMAQQNQKPLTLMQGTSLSAALTSGVLADLISTHNFSSVSIGRQFLVEKLYNSTILATEKSC